MESHDAANKSTDESIKSINRIKEYPVIKDSFSKAGEYYNWIKGQNSTLTSTLNWTENTVKGVVNKVEPLAVSHLETLDKYACSQLDNLETKYPIVKESSEDVIKSSSEYYESNIKPKVDSAKDSVAYVASTPYRITTQTIELLSNTATNFVGKYMGSANPTSTTPTDSVAVQHAYDVNFKRAVKEIRIIRNYTMTNVQHLTTLLSSIYNKTVTSNEEWVRKYYEEFRTELENKSISQSSESDTNSKLMQLALHLSNKMRLSVRAMSTVCYNHLSPEYREKMDLVFAKTEQLYSTMDQSTFDTVRDQISLENVQWIGVATLGIMNTLKDAMIKKYKDSTGKEVTVDLDSEETCDGDTADHCTINDDNTE